MELLRKNWNLTPCELLIKCFRFCLAITLMVIFAYHSETLIVKYLHQDTTLASDYWAMGFMKFPVIVICVRGGILKKNASLLPKEEFMKFHQKPQVYHLGLSNEDDVVRDIPPEMLRYDAFPTLHNGLCKRIQLLESYPERTWLVFKLNSSFEYDVFFLNEGDEYNFATQVFTEMPSVVNVRSSTQIEIQMTIFRGYKSHKFKCEDYKKIDQAECLQNTVFNKIIQGAPLKIEKEKPANSRQTVWNQKVNITGSI